MADVEGLKVWVVYQSGYRLEPFIQAFKGQKKAKLLYEEIKSNLNKEYEKMMAKADFKGDADAFETSYHNGKIEAEYYDLIGELMGYVCIQPLKIK